jgi:putative Mn2+ efflux pump MntP
MDFSIIYSFLSQWAFLPGATAIGLLIWWLSSQGYLDMGKFKWLEAIIFGLIFGVLQKFGAFIGYTPIQTEWPKVIVMGIATGLLAVLGQTVIKNSYQGYQQNQTK